MTTARPQAGEIKYFDNDGYVCQTGVNPKFVLKDDYDALLERASTLERETLERAAKVCEELPDEYAYVGSQCAEMIRALQVKP